MFSQRLDLLMELTGTSASVLGKACALDSSHVSRLRRGSRPLPKKPSFLSAMSTYFTKRIRADYQKKSLCELMSLDAWPEEEARAAEMIVLWLRGEEKSSQVEPILSSFIRATGTSVKREEAPRPLSESEAPRACYYGPEGKRAAVAQLLSLILQEAEPQTVLLFSDEEMGWLYEDPDFAALWAQECVRVLSAGNRVKIIHAIHRGIHEMLEGVAKWVPLYMTGRVEPYYYPRLRDGVFQRTLFVAPKTAAVTSGSVSRKTEGMLHAFYDTPAAVAALALEYENLLSLCRPLMRIFNGERRSEFWDTYISFLSAQGTMICLCGLSTMPTMPETVAASLQKRAPESRILETRNQLALVVIQSCWQTRLRALWISRCLLRIFWARRGCAIRTKSTKPIGRIWRPLKNNTKITRCVPPRTYRTILHFAARTAVGFFSAKMTHPVSSSDSTNLI